MDFTQKVILTNMCMLCSGTRVLVQDRVDSRWKGVAFPGGHVEKAISKKLLQQAATTLLPSRFPKQNYLWQSKN